MKKLAIVSVLVAVFYSCSKKDALTAKAPSAYQIRVAAIDTDGAKSYTSILRVKSGTVAVEFETDEAVNIKQYDVEVSTDGITFKAVKTIATDPKETNRFYRDTVVLE